MLEKYNYPYLYIVHLKMGLIRSGNTNLTPEDEEALIEYLWPVVREIIKTAIENHQNLIVESFYVPFNWRKDFSGEYLSSIRFICLAMTEGFIDKHFNDIKKHNSDIESRQDDTECTIDSLKADNHSIIEGFQHFGEQITLIDTEYEQKIKVLLG